jgi:type IV secretion system protein VirB4
MEILNFFVGGGFPITPWAVFGVVLLFLVVLLLYTNILSNAIFPGFGYKKYSEYLPFAAVLSDNSTIRMRDGSLARVFSVRGVQTSMHDSTEREKLLDLRAQLFNQIRGSGTILRFFSIRDYAGVSDHKEFDNPVLQKISDKWDSQGLKIFSNSYYIVLSTSGIGAYDKIDQYTSFIESILSVYGPKLLRHDQKDNAANFFARILSPVSKPKIEKLDANMADLVTVDNVDFGLGGVFRYSSGAQQKFGAYLSFKTSPDFMDEDFFDEVSTIQAEMINMSVASVMSSGAIESTVRKTKSTTDSTDEASAIVESQIQDAVIAMNENVSGTQNMINYYPSFAIFADSKSELEEHISQFKKISAGFGVSPVVEDFAAKVAFFAMIPGVDVFPRSFKMLSRTAAVATPMSYVPMGIDNSDWGPGPIVVFPTAQGTPYKFQFHVSDSQGAVAHTLTIGPTGGGKTTLFSFLIAQSLRHPKLKAFFFDRNRGAEIFTLAVGGKYLTFYGNSKDADRINAGFETSLNPLRMSDTQQNRAFLRRWLQMISGQGDPKSLDEIARAVSINFDYLEDKDKRLGNLWASNFSSDGAMRPALRKWVDELQYGGVFNEVEDNLDLYSRMTTFDFTDILNDETLAPAVISYIIHRINTITVSGGNPSLIMIDETAPMLANPMFRENFIVGLQEGRKNRQAYMAAFQRANVIDKLGIGDVVRGQAQTRIFFRNPGADMSDYEYWKLNPLEMAFIQGKAYPGLKRAVLLSRPITDESVVLNTELGGLGSLIRLFESGRQSVLLAEELYKTMGDEFVAEYLRRQNV